MIYLLTLEPLETRYTGQWKRWIADDLKNAGLEFEEIDGTINTNSTTNSTNFLDPNYTNVWKSDQISKISKLFSENKIKENDIFLFYDAWHYGVIALRYMSILNKIPVKIYGMWHAGSYDPHDLLGQLDKDEKLLDFEETLFQNIDKSFVATHFHKSLINKGLKTGCEYFKYYNKIKVTGFPYHFDELDKYKIPYDQKEDIVVFPHRLSKEKNPDFLRRIEPYIKGKVIFCQEEKLSKDEYHKLLAKSKIVFSASDQETWGLGTFEGLYLGCVPVIPIKLSYKEMYNTSFLYPESYLNNEIFFLIEKINKILAEYPNEKYIKLMEENIWSLKKEYCLTDNIIKELKY